MPRGGLPEGKECRTFVCDLQGGLGQGSMATVSQEKRTDDAQGRLKQAQITLETWQQSLADLIPSPSGRLDAETVRFVPCNVQISRASVAAQHTQPVPDIVMIVLDPLSMSLRMDCIGMYTSAFSSWEDVLRHRQEVQRLQAAEKDASALRTREAKLQTALAEKNLEFLELRWRLAAARETTNSSLAQVIVAITANSHIATREVMPVLTVKLCC